MKDFVSKLTIAIFCLGFYSCNNIPDGYKKKSDIIYKLHQIGEEQEIQETDYVTLSAILSTINDSILDVINNKKLQIEKSQKSGDIFDCLQTMAIGDSMSFLISPKNYLGISTYIIPKQLENEKYLKFSVKINGIQTVKEFETQKKLFISWANDLGEYEKVLLEDYINTNKINIQPTKSGLYKIKTTEGHGDKPQIGDTITINYKGKFLNGIFFDATQKDSSSFEFILGKEWQVIKGFEEAIPLMREGERAIIIMPSDLAFGTKGSSTGIIPPYTSVVYEIYLKKIAKGKYPLIDQEINLEDL